jgi:hypothetical protein
VLVEGLGKRAVVVDRWILVGAVLAAQTQCGAAQLFEGVTVLQVELRVGVDFERRVGFDVIDCEVTRRKVTPHVAELRGQTLRAECPVSGEIAAVMRQGPQDPIGARPVLLQFGPGIADADEVLVEVGVVQVEIEIAGAAGAPLVRGPDVDAAGGDFSCIDVRRDQPDDGPRNAERDVLWRLRRAQRRARAIWPADFSAKFGSTASLLSHRLEPDASRIR